MVHRILVIVSLVVGLVLGANAPFAGGELHELQFVLLHRTAEPRPMGEREVQRTQVRHFEFLSGLFAAGKLRIEGPLSRAGGLHGALILDVASTEAAREILANDPWVAPGRYRPEFHTLRLSRSVLRKPEDPKDQEWAFLGLLRRPKGLQNLSDDKKEEIQAGHVEHLGRLVESGELVLAGSIEDEGPLRGILIFRESGRTQIRESMAGDPAIQAGRLILELHPWRIPRGILPPAP